MDARGDVIGHRLCERLGRFLWVPSRLFRGGGRLFRRRIDSLMGLSRDEFRGVRP